MRIGLGLLLIVLLMGRIQAQNPAYFSLGEKKFANLDIYTLLYDDSEDILYVGSENGLHAFKQNQFISIRGPESQIGRSLFQLRESPDGKVYCSNLAGQIFQVKGNQLVLYLETPAVEIGQELQFLFDKKAHLVTLSNSYLKRTGQDGLAETIYDPKAPLNPIWANKLGKTSGLNLFPGNTLPNGDLVYSIADSRFLIQYDGSQARLVLDSLQTTSHNRKEQYFSHLGQPFWLSEDGSIAPNTQGLLAHPSLQGPDRRLHQLNDSLLIARGLRKGVQVMGIQDNVLVILQSFFTNLFVSTFHINDNGTIFLGTFGEGILVIPDFRVSKWMSAELLTSITTSPDNQVFVSTRSGKILRANEGFRKIITMRANVEKVFYFGEAPGMEYPGLEHLYLSNSKEFPTLKDACPLDQGFLLTAQANGILVYSHGQPPPPGLHFASMSRDGMCYRIVEGRRCYAVAWSAKDSLIYYADGFGVYEKPWSNPEQQELLYQGKPFFARHLIFEEGKLICATVDHGVLVFKDGQCVQQISIPQGLLSPVVSKVNFHQGLLFLRTSRGIQVYDFTKQRFLGLGRLQGLVNDQVSDFALSRDTLWLMERHSIMGLGLDQIGQPFTLGTILLDSILVNKQAIGRGLPLDFSHYENAFEFHLDYRDIETSQQVILRYQLEGFDREWKTILDQNYTIVYDYLPPGEYTFQVEAQLIHQTTQLPPITFRIASPFWITWWFVLCTALLLVGLVSIFFLYRSRRKRRLNQAALDQQQLLTAVVDSKLKALRSQMNPHFIFNALNSIQALILKRETEQSYDYVVMFSDLVRKALQYSDQDFIDMAEELDFLDLYLKLESLRLKKEFNYHLEFKGDQDIQIPSLMVQPFLENAIHHGLLHQTGNKRLEIVFQLDEVLTCTVRDNGVGRAQAQAIKTRQAGSHTSFSLEATQQRMDLFKQQYGQSAEFVVNDLYEGDQALGTEVVLTIPFNRLF